MSDYTKNEDLRFQFILYINDTNIVCQRYFNIFDFNEDSLKSDELKLMMESITGMNNGQHGSLGIIPRFLQRKSLTYLWDNYNPYNQYEETVKNIFERKDNFQFEIKIDDKTVVKTEFIGNYFPPKVRYAVNIKEIIPDIMSEIRYYLSKKKYVISTETNDWLNSQKEFLVK